MDANNSLKRQLSYDDLIEYLHKTKRKKSFFDNSPSTDAYPNPYVLPVTHLPPSPSIITDTPLALPSSPPSPVMDLIPILKKFTISTKQPQQSRQLEPQQPKLPYYTNINQALYEAHLERLASRSSYSQPMDYSTDTNLYDNVNTTLRLAFLQRHHPPST